MSDKSDTPETDAAQIREAETRWGVEPQVWPLVRADFARRLERQRDELAEALRKIAEMLSALRSALTCCEEERRLQREELVKLRADAERLVMEECAAAVEGSEDQWITREAASALIRVRMP